MSSNKNYVPEFEKGSIDLSNFDYPRWNPKDDNEIKIKYIKRYLEFNTFTPASRKRKVFIQNLIKNGLPENEVYVKAFDKMSYPLIPDSMEVIKRKDWAVFEDLLGEKLEILHHPVFTEMHKYICDHFKRKSDILIVRECGKKKPYRFNEVMKNLVSIKKKVPELKKVYDFAVLSNSGVVPLDEGNDFSFCYPFRYYDWNHGVEEAKGIRQDVEDTMYNYLSNFIKKTGYKKVAILSKDTSYPSYINIYHRLKKDMPELDVYWAANDENVDRFVARGGLNTRPASRNLLRFRYISGTYAVLDVLKYFKANIPNAFLKYMDGVEERHNKRISKKAKKIALNEKAKADAKTE